MSDDKMRAAFETWKSKHMTMDGYPQYSPDDVWEAGCAWQASRTAQSEADNTPSDFQYGQWWVVELDTAAQAHGATDEFKRAVAVVHRLLQSISAQREADAVKRVEPVAVRWEYLGGVGEWEIAHNPNQWRAMGFEVRALGVITDAPAAPAQSEAKPVEVVGLEPDHRLTDVTDALAGWQFKRSEGERYWVVLTPAGCFALARDADDERITSRILAQLAAALAQRGDKT